MVDDDAAPSRPLFRYWWFWAVVAMVMLALFKQVFGIDLFESLGEVDTAQPTTIKAICQLVFPCNLVWDMTAPQDLRSAPAPVVQPRSFDD